MTAYANISEGSMLQWHAALGTWVVASVCVRRNHNADLRCADNTGTAASLQRMCWHAWQHMRCWQESWRTPKQCSPLWSSCTSSIPRGSVPPLFPYPLCSSSLHDVKAGLHSSLKPWFITADIKTFGPLPLTTSPTVLSRSSQSW